MATRLAAKPAPPLELQGPAPIFPGLMSSAPRFGNGQALHKHEPKVMSPRADWSGPPAPGHYDVGQNKDPKFPSPRASSFGGNLSKEDRSKTGLHGIAMKGRNLPGPNSYSVDEYVKTKSRVPTFKFGASSRGALNGSAILPPPPPPCRACGAYSPATGIVERFMSSSLSSPSRASSFLAGRRRMRLHLWFTSRDNRCGPRAADTEGRIFTSKARTKRNFWP